MNTQDVISDFTRYATMIGGMLRAEFFRPTAETETSIQVERGIVYPALVKPKEGGPLAYSDAPFWSAIERVIEMGRKPAEIGKLAVVDGAGHHRPAYRPLLLYACFQAFRMLYETLPRVDFGRWEESLRAWADLLESDLGAIEIPSGAIPASRAASVCEAVWAALALSIASKIYIRDAWMDLASTTFGRLVLAQRDTGAFYAASGADNPETWWYHELVTLHAAATFAVHTEDRPLAAAVKRNSNFHLNETQNDHATSEPWGLFAFIWNPAARSTADAMLHAAETNPTGVTQILLADALNCLRLFL